MTTEPLDRRLRRFFRGDRPVAPAGQLGHLEPFLEARALVHAFYVVILFLTLADIFPWRPQLEGGHLEPRWPIFWMRWLEPRLAIPLVHWIHLLGALIGVIFYRYRAARIAVFVSLLMFNALRFSFGAINHGEHLGLLLSMVLVFLPAGWSAHRLPTRRVRAATLVTFSACQGMILLIYSMSGLWKVIGLARQIVAGEVHYLMPTGLAQQVAAKLLETDTVAPLGPWLIDNYWLGPPLAAGSIYLEMFALWVVLRPSLHRPWAIGLILFHLSTQLTMGIAFLQHPLWLALFLVLSPFRPEATGWRQSLAELPLVGRLVRSRVLGR